MIRNLLAAHKTVWHNTSSVTASYTYRASRGVLFSAGATYMTGAAITPHVPNALTVTLQSNLFF